MLFRSASYSSLKSSSDKIACLVCGFDSKTSQYKKAIEALQSADYTVIVYEYDDDVFSKGNPALLPQLIDEISADFNHKSTGYKNILATGVSLGAYIAFNVQRRNPHINRGIYGTAGISVAHAIFSARVFRSFKHAFEANGYTKESLLELWKDIEILEDLELERGKSLVIVMGRLDKIVRYKDASCMMEQWKKNGIKVDYFSKKLLGHTTTIEWYKRNLSELLALPS